MPRPVPKPPPPHRSPRADGDATRARILEVAGRQFSLRGYAATTSKAICEAAQTNMAAVNYHFGGREGLYAAVLREVHANAVALDFVVGLADADLPVEEKLDRLVEGLCAGISAVEQWRTRLWARELIEPTPMLNRVIQTENMPKIEAVKRIVIEAIGVAPSDPAASYGVFAITSPLFALLVLPHDVPGPTTVLRRAGAPWLAEHMKAYVRGGIASLREQLRGRAGAGR